MVEHLLNPLLKVYWKLLHYFCLRVNTENITIPDGKLILKLFNILWINQSVGISKMFKKKFKLNLNNIMLVVTSFFYGRMDEVGWKNNTRLSFLLFVWTELKEKDRSGGGIYFLCLYIEGAGGRHFNRVLSF